MVNFKSYQIHLIVIVLVVVLVGASFVFGDLDFFPDTPEQFSEFWLLDADRMTENYPFNVSSGASYTVFVDVANHMGSSQQYRVYAKFRDSNQSVLERNTGLPSSSSPLYEFEFSIEDEEVWGSAVNFGFQDVSVEDDVLTVGDVIINGVVHSVDASTSWDSRINGFYFELFFELWRYDADLRSFRFDDRSVGIRLNMTSS